jgi:hypothetical protein
MQLGVGLIRYSINSLLAKKNKIAKYYRRIIALVRTGLFILFPIGTVTPRSFFIKREYKKKKLLVN